MNFAARFAAIAGLVVGLGAAPGLAQTNSPPPQGPPPANQYSSNEVIDAGHHFFGGISRGLASVVEKAVSQWGQPNGYILGEEASGAFIGGLRYGDGTLYTKNAGDLRVFWQGPSLGFDAGADGARTMMLVYNLPRTDGDLRSVRRRRRLGLFRRRVRHDGADRQRHRRRADPLRRRTAARRQLGYLKFTTEPDLEPVLTVHRGGDAPRTGRRRQNSVFF